jgi:hypothetical protein
MDTKGYTAVYIMADSTTKVYKIGISNDPNYRKRTLQRDKYSVVLYAYVYLTSRDKAFSFERELHQMFNEKRLQGEWFELTDEELESIINAFREVEEERRVFDNQDGFYLSDINLNHLRIHATADEQKDVISELTHINETVKKQFQDYRVEVRKYIEKSTEKDNQIEQLNLEIQANLTEEINSYVSKNMDLHSEIMSLKWKCTSAELSLKNEQLKHGMLKNDYEKLKREHEALLAKHDALFIEKSKNKLALKRKKNFLGFTINI